MVIKDVGKMTGTAKSRIEENWGSKAGKLPLDFANTAEWHRSSNPSEMVNSYSDLVRWSQDAGLFDAGAAQAMLSEADQHPRQAKAVLRRSLSLREAIFGIFTSVAGDEKPKESDLALLNQFLGDASQAQHLVHTSEGFDWVWDQETLDRMLGPIARSAADLLTSDDLKRVGVCADDRGCGWLFFDTSRNHSRRWCSMESCGNRAKAMRHYQRN
jgi:predicted RNA-binding Zn ribbon-like protein